jgi:hypothetical protein
MKKCDQVGVVLEFLHEKFGNSYVRGHYLLAFVLDVKGRRSHSNAFISIHSAQTASGHSNT